MELLRGQPRLSTCVGGLAGRRKWACMQGMPGLQGGQEERKVRQDEVEQRAPVLKEVKLGFHLIGNGEPLQTFQQE